MAAALGNRAAAPRRCSMPLHSAVALPFAGRAAPTTCWPLLTDVLGCQMLPAACPCRVWQTGSEAAPTAYVSASRSPDSNATPFSFVLQASLDRAVPLVLQALQARPASLAPRSVDGAVALAE